MRVAAHQAPRVLCSRCLICSVALCRAVPRCACVQVVGLSKLRTKYESHEAKRQLCNSFDLFLADERVLPSLPKLLGGCAGGEAGGRDSVQRGGLEERRT